MSLFRKKSYSQFVKALKKEQEELVNQKKALESIIIELLANYGKQKVDLLKLFDELYSSSVTIGEQTKKVKQLQSEIRELLGKEDK